MICQFCGYEFDGACGKYGCPNCNGEGLDDEPEKESEDNSNKELDLV